MNEWTARREQVGWSRSLISIFQRNAGWLLIFLCVALLPFGTMFNVPMAIMAAAGAWYLLRRQDLRDDPRVRLLGLLFLCIWLPMVTSLVGAVEPERSLRTVGAFVRFPFAGAFVILVLRDDLARRRLQWTIFALLTFWSADAIIQWAAGRNLFGWPYSGVQLTGIFHPNRAIGQFLAVLLPIYLEIIRQWSSRFPALWALTLPMLAVIVLSASRTAWLMLAIGLAVWGLYVYCTSQWHHKHKFAITMVILAVAAMPIAMSLPGMQDRVQLTALMFKGDYDAINEATSLRLPVWSNAIQMAQDHWLTGIGPRGYRYIYADYAADDDPWVRPDGLGMTHPHQYVLEVVAETGFIGLIGFIAFLLILTRAVLANATAHSIPWTVSLLVAWFPFHFHWALYATLWSHFIWLVLMITIALCSAGHRSNDRASSYAETHHDVSRADTRAKRALIKC